jgi:RNA polymerase subunit RPABC4/transcription elongation factor Spt4
MTTCRDCSHVFSERRPRCPACGTVPKAARVFNNEPRVREERAPRERRVVLDAADACKLCHQGGKTNSTCPRCGGKLHRHCVGLHVAHCGVQ